MKNIDAKKLYEECLTFSEKIKNPILRECAQKIYADYEQKLINKPATPGSHHYFKGGLISHIHGVTKNAIAICELYPELAVDIDLVVFGALLHDIGKTNDYADFTDNADYNPNLGNGALLLGHSYEGAHIVETYLSNYDINPLFKNQALHMIGSHMNDFSDWGTLVRPKMLEVLIINFADKIDADLEPAHEVLSNATPGEAYKIRNQDASFYKSLNEYYKK